MDCRFSVQKCIRIENCSTQGMEGMHAFLVCHTDNPRIPYQDAPQIDDSRNLTPTSQPCTQDTRS